MISGCWEWSGCRTQDGYGVITLKKRRWIASRLIYTNLVGDIPPGMFVCHRCDNPPCVNPEHLFLGTYQDNVDDMLAKNRWQKLHTHCKRGHEFTPENTRTLIQNGRPHRWCRKCGAQFAARKRAEKKGEYSSSAAPSIPLNTPLAAAEIGAGDTPTTAPKQPAPIPNIHEKERRA